MANPRICSIDGCGKGGKLRRGYCGVHYSRWKRHGDPHKVLGPGEGKLRGPAKGWHRVEIDIDWLRRVYLDECRPVGDIAATLGYSVEHTNKIIEQNGIPRRDARAGARHDASRVKFDLARAAWLYEIVQMNCEDIGLELGVHGCTVRRRLREAGIRIRHQNETKRGAKAKNRIDLNEKKVVKEYLKPMAGRHSVAEKFGVSANVIGRILDAHGVPRKHITEIRETVSGPDHPSWRDDITLEEREMRRDANKQNEWRFKVYERDGFTCQRCGDGRGGNLNAHHIEGHASNKKLRWVLSNGITLCVDCHRGFHRIYGISGFGRRELDEYLQSQAT